MTFPLPAGMEDKLQAALIFQGDTGSAYILLAPAGWKASAVTGANGSLGATFEDPENPGQTLQYTDNAWGCQGCAVGSIGTYFPGKAEWADEYGLTIIPPAFTEQYMAGTRGADARTVRYSLPAEARGYETAGTAYYDEGEWGYLFRKLEMTTSSAFDGQDVIDSIQGFLQPTMARSSFLQCRIRNLPQAVQSILRSLSTWRWNSGACSSVSSRIPLSSCSTSSWPVSGLKNC